MLMTNEYTKGFTVPEHLMAGNHVVPSKKKQQPRILTM